MISDIFIDSLIPKIKRTVSQYCTDVNQSIRDIFSGNYFPSDINHRCIQKYGEPIYDLIDNVCKLKSSVTSNVTTIYKQLISVKVDSNMCVKLMNSSKWDVYMTSFLYILTIESIRFTVNAIRIIRMLAFIILPNKYSIQYNYDKFDYETSNECLNNNRLFIRDLNHLFWLRSMESYSHMYLNMFSKQMVYDRFYIRTNPNTLFMNIIERENVHTVLNEFNDNLVNEKYYDYLSLGTTCSAYTYYDDLDKKCKNLEIKELNIRDMNINMSYEIICRTVKYNEKILGAIKKNLSIDCEYAKNLFLYDFIEDLKNNMIIIYQE